MRGRTRRSAATALAATRVHRVEVRGRHARRSVRPRGTRRRAPPAARAGQRAQRRRGDLLDTTPARGSPRPATTMFGLSSIPSSATRCSKARRTRACSTSPVTSSQRSRVCVAVHQHLGLDDRHQPLLLAERGVARERVRVRLDAGAVGSPSPMWITARHLAKRAPSRRYSSSRSRRPSRPSVTSSPATPASGLAPASTLMPGMMPARASSSTQRHAARALLADRLVLQDDAADELAMPGVVKQHLAIVAPALRRRLDPARVEALA